MTERHTLRYRRLAGLWAALLTVALAAPAPALQPTFSSEDSGATRDVKVCILLLQATSWENPEPFFLPTLASSDFQKVRNLRPAHWNLVNPLASSIVTPEMADLWDKSFEGTVTFDGVSALVDNDALDNGNDTGADLAANQARYNDGAAGGPNSYLAHAQPTHLAQFGTNGSNASRALPAVGQPLPKTHPAYWEVPLTPKTVTELTNFDAVFVNTHRNLRFTQQEQVLLKQFLDQGGTLFLEDSHGSRIEVVSGGDETNPNDVDFFLKFQFVDGWPYARETDGTRAVDGYPINRGGVSSLSPSKVVVSPNHPLLNILHPLTPSEADRLGDVRARDHLIMRPTSSIYLVEEVLRTVNGDAEWGNPTGDANEPAVAVARIGSGKLVLSGIDMIDDCSKPYETGVEPDEGILPDIKFMFNLLAWRGGVGGNRRGGANNQGVAGSDAADTYNVRFAWHWPQGGPSGSFYRPEIETVGTPDEALLATDLNYGLKEPITTANGVVYLQYQSGTDYYLVAIDADPTEDLDGDGSDDDGIRDMINAGATSDTLWLAGPLTQPIIGGTVVSIQHQDINQPIDVLFTTQADEGSDSVILRAWHATMDAQINAAAGQSPGDPFYNWTSAVGGLWGGSDPDDGFTQLGVNNGLVAEWVSAPVAYDDHLYVAASTNHGNLHLADGGTDFGNASPGEWIQIFAVRMVPEPGGEPAGAVSWVYPDPTQPGEAIPTVISTANEHYLEMLKQVDAVQHWPYSPYAGGDPNYGTFRINYLSPNAALQEAHVAGSAQSVVPTVADPTHLLPVIGLARDARTGLIAPTVFFNRANGDVWAVNAFPESMGWRIDGDIDATSVAVVLGATNVTARFSVDPVIVRDWVNGVDRVTGVEIKVDDSVAGNVDWYRTQPYYEPITIQYQRNGSTRVYQEQRRILPRHRLLRADRDSGYEGLGGKIDLLGWSTGAPMLWDQDTLVATSSALWLGAHEPSATYSDESNATTGVGRGSSGVASPQGYQIRASSPVTFFSADGESTRQGSTDYNRFGPVRWVFDTGMALPDGLAGGGSLLNIIDANLGGGGRPLPTPQTRATFSVYGSPVRYGDSVVVAGAIAAPGGGLVSGGVIALTPNPVLSADVPGLSLARNDRLYLLAVNPNGGYGFTDQILSSMPDPTTSTRPLRHYVIDPDQYTLDFGRNRLFLKADQAHLTRLAQPMPDSVAGSREPFPEALRLPLYGRLLYLVRDDGDGVYSAANDELAEIWVPSPIKWMHVPYTVQLDARARPTLQSIRVAGATSDLAGGYGVDLLRPQLIRFTDTTLAGQIVYVTYTLPSGASVTEKHRVPAPMPGFSFSPVIAEDTIYVAGTQLPTMNSLPNPVIPEDVPLDTSVPNGGLYAFQFGGDDHVVEVDRVLPDTVPAWSNYAPNGLENSYVRGLPLPVDQGVFVSFGLDGDGSGSGDADHYVAPLLALGGSRMLVTENLRLARVDYDGRVHWQLTGTKEKNGAERPRDQITNNPQPTELLTTLMARPARAYNLDGDNVLLVDTGNNRVVEVDGTGLILWPTDTRTGQPDSALRYLGLRNLGLNRPTDALRFQINQTAHPSAQIDVDNDGNDDNVTKDVTVVADEGNGRIVMVVSYPRSAGGGQQTWYEPLGAVTDNAGGGAWELTASQVYNPGTKEWVTMPWTQVQVWDPRPGEPDYDAANAGWDHYYVARATGSGQLFKIDPDTDNDGVLDNDGDGVVDGLKTNLSSMLDDWSGGKVFRGLRYFRRFRVGQDAFLATVQAEPTSQSAATVAIWSLSGGALSTQPIWTFTRSDYFDLVYESGADDSYYERQLQAVQGLGPAASLGLRNRWSDSGSKAWNPVSVVRLPNQNLLAIVNGAANSVNQTGSNSEVILVRFNPGATAPNDRANKRVEHVLPDLATTSTYPAGPAASQRKPADGSYPVSSPVFAHQ